jgi:uncharacterized protein YlxW (UPF0749 family)
VGGDRHRVGTSTAWLVLLVFGLLVTVAAVQTSRNAASSHASRASLIHQVELRRAGLARLQRQVQVDETRVLALRTSLSGLSTRRQATSAKLQRLRVRTGFGAVQGPGIQVSVNSAPGSAGTQLVRDSDLTLLTDALWVAGAEAISVNGERLTALSAFRNVGIGILVNDQPIAPPYNFKVVGNPDAMPAALLSSSVGEEWYALKSTLGFRFDVHDGGTMSLPAAAPQQLRSARIASPDKGHSRTQGDSAP